MSKTKLLLSLPCENDVASQLVVFSYFVRSADPEQSNMASSKRSRSRSNMASGRRSRSRSSVPRTPTIPSDPGQVSGEDDQPHQFSDPLFLFHCNVIMSSGESLKSFECNEHTSIGWIRSGVWKILTDKQRYWGNSHEFASFLLLQGERICESDDTEVYQLFPNLETESCGRLLRMKSSCVLTVVILRK